MPQQLIILFTLAVVAAAVVSSSALPHHPDQSASAQKRQAGILYEVWHSRASDAMRTVYDKHGQQLTTELVIRSNGSLTLDDVYGPYGLAADIYNVQPQLGFYCLYRPRAGDVPNPPMRECENISGTAAAHAAMLVEAGFDYVAADVTNWPVFNYSTDRGGNTDVVVIRPIEVLFEEWARLRQLGKRTPQIAPWVCSPAQSTTWQYFLQYVYNNPAWQDLIYRRPQSGKMTFFVPANPSCMDAEVRTMIESNGGLNNIETVPMWALFGASTYAQGNWGFFSPCTTPDGGFTTSMVGVGACHQPRTSINGTEVEISASGGYMVSQCALPFASPGHMRGLTLARLFEDVLEQGAPDLFVSSFNEHIGGRQAPASGANIAFNMGLPFDSQRAAVWVDTYAAEFSRDLEPTVEGGGRLWEVARACVQLYKQGLTCTSIADAESNACCSRADKEIFANVWSLQSSKHEKHHHSHEHRGFAASDYLLTSNGTERAQYIAGGSYSEVCAAIPNPSVFCVDTSIRDGRNGPFMIYNTSSVGLPVIALHRCLDSAHLTHFVSTDPACEGKGTHEQLLGWGATRQGLEMLRALRRCLVTNSGTTVRTHSLDLLCDTPDPSLPGVLAYVR